METKDLPKANISSIAPGKNKRSMKTNYPKMLY